MATILFLGHNFNTASSSAVKRCTPASTLPKSQPTVAFQHAVSFTDDTVSLVAVMIGEVTCVMQPPWSGQQSVSCPMFAPVQGSGGMTYPRRPPPALIDMRNATISQSPQLMKNLLSPVNCSVPPMNCSVPPMNYSVPPTNCAMPPVNCSVPQVNCSVPHVNYSVPPMYCSVPPTNCSVPPMNYSVPQVNCSVPPNNCSEPQVNCSIPPVNCSGPPARCSEPLGTACSVQPTNCSERYSNYTVPQVNCAVPQTNYFGMAPHAPMPQHYAGEYYQHGYWPSASFPSGVAPSGECCGSSAPTYSQSHNNNVVRPEQPQKHSMRFAPYQKEMPAWITSHSYNAASPDDSCNNLQTRSWSAKQQQDCRQSLAEKIWRRRIETQSYLDRLNVPNERSSCAVTQQLLNEELIRCRGATTGRGMPPMRNRSPPDVPAVPLLTACLQDGTAANATRNASSLSWLKTTSSVPAAMRERRPKSCSPLRESVSVPLPTTLSSSPMTTIDQSALGMLLMESDEESTRDSLLTRTCETPTRDTSRCDVAPPAFDTVETMFFQKFPCSLFSRQPVNSQESSPSTEVHVDLPELVSPCDQFPASDTQEQPDCQRTTSSTHSEGDSVPTQTHAAYSSTEYYQKDTASSLDTSTSTVDSCEDRLYINIPQLEEAVTM